MEDRIQILWAEFRQYASHSHPKFWAIDGLLHDTIWAMKNGEYITPYQAGQLEMADELCGNEYYIITRTVQVYTDYVDQMTAQN